jgi:transmembrane sensor
LTISGKKSVEDLEAEAAAWAAKLDAAPDRTHPGLDEWFAQDPKHAGALLRAQAMLAMFEPASPVEEKPAELAPANAPWKRRAIMGGGAAALAASLAAALLIGRPGESYATQTGEVRSLALSDGSSVAIDAKSRIDIDFDAARRDVHLQAGKVLFRAAHARRPFRVIVDDIVITDVGTAFLVTDDEAAGQVDVLVTEGAVMVDGPAGRVSLVAGQRARFAKAPATKVLPTPLRVASADIERTLAWREGRLELDGETLDSAVAEINRHSRLQLRVAGAALGRESLYGSFRMDDAAGFARAAAASLGTEARADPDGIVIGTAKK